MDGHGHHVHRLVYGDIGCQYRQHIAAEDQSSFQVPLNGLVEWIIIAYLIVIAGLLLTLGRLLDLMGLKLIWVVGLIIFTGSSGLVGPRRR